MDLIERQAAIDAMKDTFKGTMVGTRVAVDAINRLPSAEPNLQPTCNQLATDCISRQSAIDAVNELTRWYYETYHEKRPTAIAVIDKLMDLPSAEPKMGKWIIRTRHEHFPSGKEYTELVCPFCGRTDHNGDGNYCGYCGAKMEVEDD